MIIDISKSYLFKDPDQRFSKEYELPEGIWNEMWRRYRLLDYSIADLQDFLFIKHARRLTDSSLERWVIKSKIYGKTRSMRERGATIVNTEVFDELEQYVIDELTKNLKPGVSLNSRTII